MAIAPTRWSRASFGWVTSSKSIVDQDAGDTGAVFSVMGNSVFSGNQSVSGTQSVGGAQVFSSTVSIGGALTQDGAATFNSTISSAGTVTAINGLIVGTGGEKVGNIDYLRGAIAAVSATAAESVSSSISWTGSAVSDVFMVTPHSTWSGSYYDVGFEAHCLAANVVNLVFRNSTTTTVSLASDTAFQLTRIRFA